MAAPPQWGMRPTASRSTSTRPGSGHGPSLGSADRALVLQGGGALGAYQAGVYEALAEASTTIGWVAGVSIGAINAALIVGNAPEHRVARLREFWNQVSSGWGQQTPPGPFCDRTVLNQWSAATAVLFGIPGFFQPRCEPALALLGGNAPTTSYYDTSPLKHTLERLIDFDRINHGDARLSVGAVNVRTGNSVYFDSQQQPLRAEHIMASGALPPGFAPVEIDGEHYWDGGLVSNTPLQYVLDQPLQPGKHGRVVFQVDLFHAHGPLPATLGEVTEREKDIRFSSRTRLGTTMELDRQVIAQAAQRLLDKLPAALRDDPDALALAGLRGEGAKNAGVDVVHLIYRSKHYESQSKDYEFSRLSMHEHWDAGRADMAHTLHDKRWTGRSHSSHGVRVFDLTTDEPKPPLSSSLSSSASTLSSSHSEKVPSP